MALRCMPLLDKGRRDRCPRPHARRQRAAPTGPAAAVQGRRHPRGPSPGQEQPADHLVPAPPAVPPDGRRRAAITPSRRPSDGSAASPWSTRSCHATPPTRSTSTTSCPRWSAWPRISAGPTARSGSPARGEAGELHAAVATPLAVVITELLQNAAEHGWPEAAPPDRPGRRGRRRPPRRRMAAGREQLAVRRPAPARRRPWERPAAGGDRGPAPYRRRVAGHGSGQRRGPAAGVLDRQTHRPRVCRSCAGWCGPSLAASSACTATAGPSSTSPSPLTTPSEDLENL